MQIPDSNPLSVIPQEKFETPYCKCPLSITVLLYGPETIAPFHSPSKLLPPAPCDLSWVYFLFLILESEFDMKS